MSKENEKEVNVQSDKKSEKKITKKIASLEKQIGNDSSYKNIVANLKNIIKKKEAEINSLKEIIENQKTTISKQKSTITEQKITIEQQGQQINNQQEQLQQAVKRQASLLYDAAYEFEQLAQEAPDVSKKKNPKKVNDWAIGMLSRSLQYYQELQKYGVDASVPISRIKRKITTLRQQ